MRCLHALQVLDVEKDVSAEGVGSFDIIFATNVLHATRNMSNTLLNCKVCSVDHLLSYFCRAVRMHECGLPDAERRRIRPCSYALQLQIQVCVTRPRTRCIRLIPRASRAAARSLPAWSFGIGCVTLQSRC